MSSPSRVWPEIVRLPGERLLEGIPHTKTESVFSEAGVADACDVLASTKDLNSKQRRVTLEEFTQRTDYGKDQKRSQAALDALGRIANQELTDNHPLALRASFLKSVLQEQVTVSAKDEVTEVKEESLSPYPHSMNIEWASALIDTDLGKSNRHRKLEKDEVLAHTVARLVTRDNQNDPAIIEAGAGLHNRFIDDSDSLSDRLINFAALATGIDRAKVKAIGFRGTTAVSNMIIQSAGATLAAKVRPEEIEDAVTTVDKLIATEMKQSPHLRSMVPKFTLLKQNLKLRQEAHKHARSMRLFGEHFANASKVPINELREQLAETMVNLSRLRKYGLKPSFFANGFLTKHDQIWVFSDPLSEGLDHPMFSNFLADITLHDASDVAASLTTGYEDVVYGTDTKVTAKKVPIYQGLLMLPDGELVISSSVGVLPLRREYQAANAEATYDLIRLSLLTNFIDLVVPKQYTEPLPSIGTTRSGFLDGLRNTVKFANISDLLIPRIKLLRNNTDAIETDIQQEIATSRRRIREHDVIWHTRHLPKGYEASAAARAEALKRGIELEAGETFVKTHTRGNSELGRIEGYKARTRF